MIINERIYKKMEIAEKETRRLKNIFKALNTNSSAVTEKEFEDCGYVYQKMVELRAEIEKNGSFYITPAGTKKISPEMLLYQQLSARYTQMVKVLLSALPPQEAKAVKKQEDLMADFLKS